MSRLNKPANNLVKLGDKPTYKIVQAKQAMLSSEQLFHKKMYVFKTERKDKQNAEQNCQNLPTSKKEKTTT